MKTNYLFHSNPQNSRRSNHRNAVQLIASPIFGFLGGLLLVVVPFVALLLHSRSSYVQSSFGSRIDSPSLLILKSIFRKLINKDVDIDDDFQSISMEQSFGVRVRLLGLNLNDVVKQSSPIFSQFPFASSSSWLTTNRRNELITVKNAPLSFGLIPAMWNSLNDGYLPEYTLRPMEQRNDDMLYIHTWYSGDLYSGFEVVFDSMLATQDLRKSKFIFWMNQDWLESSDERKHRVVHKYRYSPNRFIEFRLANVTELVKLSNSCWKDRPEFLLVKPLIDRTRFSSWTNVLRILLLHIYGGVWVDADSLALVDFHVMHEKVPKKLVAGKIEVGPSNDTEDTNRGHFNNNFLYLTDIQERNTFMNLSCDFRLTPIRYPRLNYTREELKSIDFNQEWEWRDDFPLGYKGHELRIYMFWIWNDGVLRHCSNNLNRCHLQKIPLGRVDPIWATTRELSTYCEDNHSRLSQYTVDFWKLYRDVLLKGPSKGAAQYWREVEFNDLVWTIHTRASSCRTLDVRPIGTFSMMDYQIRSSLGPDYRLAPIESIDWMTYEPMQQGSRQSFISFLKSSNKDFLTIIVKSNIANWERRDALRHQFLKLQFLQSEYLPSVPSRLRLLFVVAPHPTPTENGPEVSYANWWDGHLITENNHYRDMLIVGPLTEQLHNLYGRPFPPGKNTGVETRSSPTNISFPISTYSQPFSVPENYSTDGTIPSLLELGIMKWGLNLNQLSDYLFFIYDDRVVLNVNVLSQLINILEIASNRRLRETLDPNESSMTSARERRIDLMALRKGQDANPLKEDRRNFNIKNITYKKMVSNWNLSNLPTKFSEATTIGLIARIDLVPLLLSSTNPVRKDFESRRIFSTSRDCENLAAGTVRPPDSFLRNFGQTYKQCRERLRQNAHPLIGQLDMKRIKESYGTKKNEVLLHVVDFEDVGLYAIHNGHLSKILTSLFPSFSKDKATTNDAICLNPFSLTKDGIDNSGTKQQELEDKILLQLRQTLLITDLECVEWTPIIDYYSSLL